MHRSPRLPALPRCAFWITLSFLLSTFSAPSLEGATRKRNVRPAPQKAAPAEPEAAPAGDTRYQQQILPNGIVVGVTPIPGVKRVAVEAIYRVGFLHEPAGMPQSSHLLEHLVIQGGIPGYARGEAMKSLTADGMANAETLPSFTHYDYAGPLERLELFLSIEAARLKKLTFDADLIRAEAAKCYQETAVVERNPQVGMLKHAFMALNQGWQHGRQTASVRSGLESFDLEDLRAFHKKHYVPNNLAIMICGGVTAEQGFAAARAMLADIPRGPELPAFPVDWTNAPAHNVLEWDAKPRAFCVAFAPLPSAKERLLMTLLGSIMQPKLQASPELSAATDAIYCSNASWPVGVLPFFVYATPKTNTTLLKMQQIALDLFQVPSARRPSGPDMQQLRLLLAEVSARPAFTSDLVHQHAETVARQTRQEAAPALDTVILNIALQAGIGQMLLQGVSANDLNDLARMSQEEIERIYTRAVDPSRQRLSILLPKPQPK